MNILYTQTHRKYKCKLLGGGKLAYYELVETLIAERTKLS